MKRILFLSFAYPYGHFGPSDNCTARIMKALVQTREYEVFNIACKPDSVSCAPNYNIIEGVHLVYLPFPEKLKKHSRAHDRFRALLSLPIYPLFNLNRIIRYYRACKAILKNEHYDLVVSQCFPIESVISSVLLRRDGIIDRLMVLFWDNIYGKLPRIVIPKWFALYRQKRLEYWVAKYTDRLVSPFPVKAFHDKYGDVNSAIGKRYYVEHPSLLRPSVTNATPDDSFIKPGKINIVYSGRLYSKEDVSYFISLLNSTEFADQTNVTFFSRGISPSDSKLLCDGFKGCIQFSDWIPLDCLLALYPYVDVFVSFTGNPAQITSKVYEYMSFGKPIIHMYRVDEDINVTAFARYPYFLPIDVKQPIENQKESLVYFIANSIGKGVSFEEVERLFPTATASAYVKLIAEMVSDT